MQQVLYIICYIARTNANRGRNGQRAVPGDEGKPRRCIWTNPTEIRPTDRVMDPIDIVPATRRHPTKVEKPVDRPIEGLQPTVLGQLIPLPVVSQVRPQRGVW